MGLPRWPGRGCEGCRESPQIQWDAEHRWRGPPHSAAGGCWACSGGCRGVRAEQDCGRKLRGPAATGPGPGPWRGCRGRSPSAVPTHESEQIAGFCFPPANPFMRAAVRSLVSVLWLHGGQFQQQNTRTVEETFHKSRHTHKKGDSGLHAQVEAYQPTQAYVSRPHKWLQEPGKLRSGGR